MGYDNSNRTNCAFKLPLLNAFHLLLVISSKPASLALSVELSRCAVVLCILVPYLITKQDDQSYS